MDSTAGHPRAFEFAAIPKFFIDPAAAGW